jgi:hypothetical protein
MALREGATREDLLREVGRLYDEVTVLRTELRYCAEMARSPTVVERTVRRALKRPAASRAWRGGSF